MGFEAVSGVGAEDGVRSRVVGIRVHRVRTVEVVRRRKAHIVHIQRGEVGSHGRHSPPRLWGMPVPKMHNNLRADGRPLPGAGVQTVDPG